MRIEYTIFPPLFHHLEAHIENAMPLSDEDMERACHPGVLIYVAMAAGQYVEHRGKRVNDLPSAPLTHRAQRYERCKLLSVQLADEIERRMARS